MVTWHFTENFPRNVYKKKSANATQDGQVSAEIPAPQMFLGFSSTSDVSPAPQMFPTSSNLRFADFRTNRGQSIQDADGKIAGICQRDV